MRGNNDGGEGGLQHGYGRHVGAMHIGHAWSGQSSRAQWCAGVLIAQHVVLVMQCGVSVVCSARRACRGQQLGGACDMASQATASNVWGTDRGRETKKPKPKKKKKKKQTTHVREVDGELGQRRRLRRWWAQ